jgi:hypothetical protein
MQIAVALCIDRIGTVDLKTDYFLFIKEKY